MSSSKGLFVQAPFHGSESSAFLSELKTCLVQHRFARKIDVSNTFYYYFPPWERKVNSMCPLKSETPRKWKPKFDFLAVPWEFTFLFKRENMLKKATTRKYPWQPSVAINYFLFTIGQRMFLFHIKRFTQINPKWLLNRWDVNNMVWGVKVIRWV